MVAETIPTTRARDSLEKRYSAKIVERLDWGQFVNYGSNRKEPVYGWFRFKEAFSRKLVQHVLGEEWKLPKTGIVLDSFAGCGTTLLAASDLGYRTVGCDIMPIAVFITQAKLNHAKYDVEKLERAASKLLQTRQRVAKGSWPDVQIVELAFSAEAAQQILIYREQISAHEDSDVRRFLMLALLASLEEASFTSKDGQFLRLVSRQPKSVRDALEVNVNRMLADLRSRTWTDKEAPRTHGESEIFYGDARKLPRNFYRLRGKIAGIVTSPPYLNRYDYSRSYALELCLMQGEDGEPCVKEFGDLKTIRHSLLRSHIESRPAPTDLVHLDALDEILDELAAKALNNARIPIMIEGYFEDMNLAISEMERMLRPGGRVALVIANARFEGELIPVDLMLSELAANHGLETEEIWVTRYKGNSSQQMGKYGKVPVRESVCFWRKA